jgi:hypothetical protein
MPTTKSLTHLMNKKKVGLSSTTLIQRLVAGAIHCSDFKCLNATIEKVLWKILLTSGSKLSLMQEKKLCA